SSDRYPKPSAALYDTCIAPEFPHIGRGEILVVGDTELDLRFAANIGARSCWAAFGYGDEEACKALGPDFVISDVRQLPHILSVHSGGPTSP
ncbi:MAG: HAD family hydrolase, partial [Acidobacteria bacterium]